MCIYRKRFCCCVFAFFCEESRTRKKRLLERKRKNERYFHVAPNSTYTHILIVQKKKHLLLHKTAQIGNRATANFDDDAAGFVHVVLHFFDFALVREREARAARGFDQSAVVVGEAFARGESLVVRNGGGDYARGFALAFPLFC